MQSETAPVTNPSLEGYRMLVKMWTEFWNPTKKTFTSRWSCHGVYGDEKKFNVWSVAVALEAITDGARLYPKEITPMIDLVINALLKYKSPEHHGYCAVENFSGNKDIYYDDDAQVAIGLINAYEVTGGTKRNYLDLARDLLRFLIGGYNYNNNKAKGGVYWHVSHDYVNACTTAEVAIACLKFAKFVPNERNYYVQFAAQCIEWQINTLMDPKDFLIKDGKSENSDNINGAKWSYNTGTTLSAACYLYHYTKSPKWLKIANNLVSAATSHHSEIFDRDYPMEKRYWRDMSYFVQLLFEGLADYMLFIGPEASQEVKDSIEYEFKRHLAYFRKFNYDKNDGFYYQCFECHQTSEDAYKIYKAEWNGHKNYNQNKEDHAKNLIGAASAARIWFQGARVVPELDPEIFSKPNF
ncbi:glycoside hydrolase family 76 protein [Ascoidea rubescens DSM 1968]|uniref:Glycoside hydrolase family 76 protein n=1 Tax=Ascoidea rubescens DSM 1968 TaxID=1344418 RepID=A0A1D2V8S7_9ASCO|nr:glycoside hydrolase family 76 protein [Ascoidea rubescens DSM 1968]ODV58111.1 glycoside hydrolase family 76 protein [Ascoidea rubescens DSM 1968]